jgi:hypothetical protein
MYFLITYTRDSEQHAITVPLLISTNHHNTRKDFASLLQNNEFYNIMMGEF